MAGQENDRPTIAWGEFAVQISLLVISSVLSVGGNGLIEILLIRFKKLRTIPNILIANMALIDLLNLVTSMPTSMVSYVLRGQYVWRSKSVAFAIGFLYALFLKLNLFSMILLAGDRYGAIVHGMKYMLWKTRMKVFVAIGLVWGLSLVLTAVKYIPFLEINIPNGTVTDYRRAQFFKTGRFFPLITVPLPVTVLGILSLLTWREMSQARKMLPGVQNISAQVRQKRKMNDRKATKTMAVTFVVFFLGYIPVLIYTVYVIREVDMTDSWLEFFAFFSSYVSSSCNPIIYALRTRRFRHAVIQLWRDPCGKKTLKEVSEGRGSNPAVQRLSQRRNGIMVPLDRLEVKDIVHEECVVQATGAAVECNSEV